MSGFDKDQALSHYRELNKAEDDLARQDRLQDAKFIHLRMREMEQEALLNGYRLTVRNDSMFVPDGEEICFIEALDE